jgi:Protein  of unknown function (DUF3018)
MMGVHERLTGAQRQAKHRAAMRAKGLRLRQIWVPDLRDPEVRERWRLQIEAMNRRDREDGVMEYIDYDWGGEDPSEPDRQ